MTRSPWPRTPWPRPGAPLLLLLALSLLILPGIGRAASLLDPLGDLWLIDPQTLDSGLLQRGAAARGGAGGEGGELFVGLEAPFYHEVSVRAGYAQDLWIDAPDGHRVSWRLRMPILQTAEVGQLDALVLHYQGEAHLRRVDPLAPSHTALVGHVAARGRRGPPLSRHDQLGVLVRQKEQADGLARAGITGRQATIVQLRGFTGQRSAGSLALSLWELNWSHYGLVARMDGRLDLSFAAPSVHWGQGRRTLSFGVAPRYRLAYQRTGVQQSWAGLASLSLGSTSSLE